MRLKYLHLFAVLLFFLTAVAPATAQDAPLANALPSPRRLNSGPFLTDDWLVTVQPGTNPDALAAALGYTNIVSVTDFADTYIFRAANSAKFPENAAKVFQENTQILRFSQQVAYQQFARNPADDPLNDMAVPLQWHLFPSATHNPPWINLNVQAAWNAGFTGTGVQIAIVDDGLQHTHPDLQPNYFSAGSFDFNGNDSDPAPVTSGDCSSGANCHGTSAAGVAAAADNPSGTPADQNYCGVGVAYGANISGIRLTAGPSTDLMESNALRYANGSGGNTTLTNDIYSSDWGPPDDGKTLRGPGPLTRAAMADSIANGRGGLGNIYVWAGGDGRGYSTIDTNVYYGDNVNADGYANSRYVIAVGAAKTDGTPAYYSEAGAPLLVAAPSSDPNIGIATTDLMGSVGYGGYGPSGDCTTKFGGTSAAASMVSGVVALMLQANPNLTWRDVQHILVHTAVKPTAFDDAWQDNAGGLHINPRYGFGLVDASAAVNLAQTWTNVPPEISYTSPVITVNYPIPTSVIGNGLRSSVVIPANIKVEHVEVVFNATHEWRGDIEVNLTAPTGTVSQLMNPRQYDGYLYWVGNNDPNYTNWRFTTVRDWDEHSGGTWTLEVVDRRPGLETGLFKDWQIIVYGTPTTPRPPIPVQPIGDGVINFTTSNPVMPIMFKVNTTSVFQADQFELQIDANDPPVNIITIPGTPSQFIVNLPIGTYYWRIRSVNLVTGVSDWSDINSFSIGTKMNSAPVRNAFSGNTATLTWARASWAARYEIQVDDSAAFLSPLQPTTVVSGDTTALTIPLPTGLWYWRIRACESLTKCTGAWSATEPFSVTP